MSNISGPHILSATEADRLLSGQSAYNLSNWTLVNRTMSSIDSADPLPSGGSVASSFELICYCYLMPIVCMIGIIGNSANLMTLASPRLSAVTYMYLRAMAVTDIVALLGVLTFVYYQVTMKMTTVPPTHFIFSYPVAFYMAHVLLIFINWPMTTTTLLVVALTVERYISVCWPLYFRQWNSPVRAKITIVVAVFLPMIPYCQKLMEGQVSAKPVNLTMPLTSAESTFNLSSDVSSINGTWEEAIGPTLYEYIKYRPRYSAAKQTQVFRSLDLTREIFFKAIPLLAVGFFNVMIIISFKRHQDLRRKLKNSGRGPGGTSTQRDNRSLLFLLAGIVILLLVCKTPAAANNIFIDAARMRSTGYRIFRFFESFVSFRAIANVMEVCNHALNFYVFCLCSGDYRNIFMEKFPCLARVIHKSQRLRSFLRQKNNSTKTSNKQQEATIEEPLKKTLQGVDSLSQAPTPTFRPQKLPEKIQKQRISTSESPLGMCETDALLVAPKSHTVSVSVDSSNFNVHVKPGDDSTGTFTNVKSSEDLNLSTHGSSSDAMHLVGDIPMEPTEPSLQHSLIVRSLSNMSSHNVLSGERESNGEIKRMNSGGISGVSESGSEVFL